MLAPAPTPSSKELPQVFGRYLLLKRLSRGGMGEIFLGKLGEIQGFEKPVIVKKILPNLSADDEFVKRFIDEAQVAIKLNHANIAQVYEVGKVDGDYFLAIEYVEGRDLRRLITRCRELHTRLPPDLCLYVARELSAGLGYAHRRTDSEGKALALVHCDISPPNVMVSFEGEVKVIDFGIAKSAIRIAGSNPNMGFGKFGYMAPEQLVRGGIVDRRTDIYAAGVVLYEFLTGERLFVFPEGADYKQIARIVTKGEFTPVSQRDPRLDPSLDPIVGKALAPRADDRYQTAEEFRDAVQAKLYQMSPTISGDALSHFVRGLFTEEIDEERAMIASTRSVNIDEFRDQLDATTTHTVTFARAGLFGRPRSQTGSNPSLSGPSIAVSPLRRNGFVAGAAAAAMIAGGFLVYLAARRLPPPVVAPVVLKTDPALRPSDQVRDPIVAVKEPVVVTQLPPPHDDRPHKRRPTSPTKNQHGEVVTPVVVDPAAHRQSVEGKFRTIKQEYQSFKGEYGARLEPQWNAIANEIAFGSGDAKYDKLERMLESLRRDMAKVEAGTSPGEVLESSERRSWQRPCATSVVGVRGRLRAAGRSFRQQNIRPLRRNVESAARSEHSQKGEPSMMNQPAVASSSSTGAPGKRPGGLTALAVLNFVFGAIGLIVGALALLAVGAISAAVSSLGGAASEGPGAGTIYLVLGLGLVGSILEIVSGVGYLGQKRMLGRTLGSVFAVLSIVGSGLGIALLHSGFGFSTILGLTYPLVTLFLVNVTFKDKLVN